MLRIEYNLLNNCIPFWATVILAVDSCYRNAGAASGFSDPRVGRFPPIADYTGRLCPKGVSFLGVRYIKG